MPEQAIAFKPLAILWVSGVEYPLDIVGLSCHYAVNEIPKATVLLPMGAEVTTKLASPAHLLLEGGPLQVPAKLVLSVDNGNYFYTVIEGWLTHVGPKVEYGSAVIAVEITHWLSALTFSSMLCEASHPANPGDFTFAAAMAFNAQLNFTATTLGMDLFTGSNIATDLWNLSLRPWLLRIIQASRIQSHRSTSKNDSAPVGGTDIGWCERAVQYFMDTDQLPLAVSSDDSETIANAIARDVVFSGMDPTEAIGFMSQTTMWDKLLQLAATYMFAVIPFPRKASIVPFIPGLRSYFGSIPQSEMSSLETSANKTRAIRAVGLMSGPGATYRAAGGPGAGIEFNGWFVAGNEGLVLIDQAPRFLADLDCQSMYAHKAGAIGANQLAANAFNFPLAGNAPGMISPRDRRKKSRSWLDKLAHARYVTEQLKHRVGRLTGPLRFDVCPGSSIAIEGPDPGGGCGSGGSTIICQVLRVTFLVDAMSPRAETMFDLAYLRSAAENMSAATSIAQHPLYNRVWTGSYLIERNQYEGGS
jgi:hypothetical protein